MNTYIWDAPTVLSRCIASALASDAPDVMREQRLPGMSMKQGEDFNAFRARAYAVGPMRPSEGDIVVHAMFTETWDSTALGFGGVGGASMTQAYTVVLCSDHRHFLVYWAGRFAYILRHGEFDSELFAEDIAAKCTRSLGQVSYYRIKEKEA